MNICLPLLCYTSLLVLSIIVDVHIVSVFSTDHIVNVVATKVLVVRHFVSSCHIVHQLGIVNSFSTTDLNVLVVRRGYVA
jgi:hypothetical protein